MLYCFTDHVQTATRAAAYQRVLCTVALLYLTLISLMVNDLGWPSGSCSAASTVGALLCLEEVVRQVVRRVVTLLLLVVVLSSFDCSCVYDHGLASEVLKSGSWMFSYVLDDASLWSHVTGGERCADFSWLLHFRFFWSSDLRLKCWLVLCFIFFVSLSMFAILTTVFVREICQQQKYRHSVAVM